MLAGKQGKPMTRTWKAHRGLGFELIRVRDDDRHSPALQRIEWGIEEFRRVARAVAA